MVKNNQTKTLDTEFVGEHPESIFLTHYPTSIEYLDELYKKERKFINSLD